MMNFYGKRRQKLLKKKKITYAARYKSCLIHQKTENRESEM